MNAFLKNTLYFPNRIVIFTKKGNRQISRIIRDKERGDRLSHLIPSSSSSSSKQNTSPVPLYCLEFLVHNNIIEYPTPLPPPVLKLKPKK